MNPDFEQRLAAWLDGALPPDEAAAFEAELEADPALAERAANWQVNDRFIADALAPLAQAPVDDVLLARLGLAVAEPRAAALPQAANDNLPWWRRHAIVMGSAVAASMAAVLILSTQAARQPRPDDLSLALETTPSRGTARLADGRTVQPTLTVRAADGRWCREYRMEGGVGLACRDQGRWKVEAKGAGAGPDATAQIGLAGGADGSALDAAYARLGASDPLGADAEAAAMASGWNAR